MVAPFDPLDSTDRRRSPWPMAFTIGAIVLAFACGACAFFGVNALRDDDEPPVARPSASATTRPADPSAPVDLAMPDVVGKNAAVAVDELRRTGFTRIELGSQDVDEQMVSIPANWTVARQSAAAGARLPADALIVLTCTRKNQG